MARKRMIDPHIWEDPSFNNMNYAGRLLFIGMISNADDEGYLRGDPGSLKRLVFGFDDLSIREMTEIVRELDLIDTVHFFTQNNEWYAHFTHWEEYQKQRADRIQKSTYPKCVICLTGDGQLPAEVKLSKEKLSKVNNIPADKPQVLPKKLQIGTRIEELKRTELQRVVYFLEDTLSTKIVNWGKQAKAHDAMKRAGYTEEQITYVIKQMANDEFYQDKGFDLQTVANNIAQYKAKARKGAHVLRNTK